ncbi:LysM peptidoglycan-binding domain-containing protein [Oceanobacillus senegalensis]|uniref:LysM peptidoglycan-binding domain-containing protein n=1 Tax=Oceanobacillus senegalensis TaxID=1936063 RepID=UPI003CCBEE96
MLANRFSVTPENLYAVNPGVNPYFLNVGQPLFIPSSRFSQNFHRQKECITPREVELMRDERSLWEEHVAWTRMAIISLTFNLPDVDFVIARLLQNATHMGDMFRPIYGDAAASTYADLIKEHLLVAADLVKAAIAGDSQAATEAEELWYHNADKIAEFLSNINPYLQEEKVRDMFYTHLNLTKQEAITMINKDYQKDIAIYDEIEKQAREMADMISEAMIKLYPDLQR